MFSQRTQHFNFFSLPSSFQEKKTFEQVVIVWMMLQVEIFLLLQRSLVSSSFLSLFCSSCLLLLFFFFRSETRISEMTKPEALKNELVLAATDQVQNSKVFFVMQICKVNSGRRKFFISFFWEIRAKLFCMERKKLDL